MNTLYYPNQIEQTNFQNFDMIYEGIKKRGIYLLEYQDIYLKDGFISQIAEQFINKGANALIIQKDTARYSIRDICLCRTLFKQNPYNFPSLRQIHTDSISLLTPSFNNQFNNLVQHLTIVSVKSRHPEDYLNPMFREVHENSNIQIVIIDSHTDYFYEINLIAQLAKMSFDRNITIIFTSQVTSKKFIENEILLPSFLKSSLYIHSNHADLYSLTDSKEIAYDFELDIRTSSNKWFKNYFTLRPAGAYCEEG